MNHDLPHLDEFESAGRRSAFGEHSERVAVSDGRDDAGEFIMRMSERYDMSVSKVMDFMAEVVEELGPSETDSRREHFWRRALMTVFAYQGPRAFALECFVLALGTATRQKVWFDIIGCRTQVELAERWKVTKANVEKCEGEFQSFLSLPGERSDKSKFKMTEKRRSQLKQMTQANIANKMA